MRCCGRARVPAAFLTALLCGAAARGGESPRPSPTPAASSTPTPRAGALARLTLRDGRTVEGRLVEFSLLAVIIETPTGRRTFARADVLKLAPLDAEALALAPVASATPRPSASAPPLSRLQYATFAGLAPAAKDRLVRQYVRRQDDGTCVVERGAYRVVSELPAERTLAVAVYLEDFHARVTQIFVGEFRLKRQPEVRLFATRSEFLDYLRQKLRYNGEKSTAVFSSTDSGGCLLAYEGENLFENLQHEGSHQLLHYYVGPGVKIPSWLDEGLATNVETWDLARDAKTNVARSPGASQWHDTLAELSAAGRLPPLAEFFKQTWDSNTNYRENRYPLAWSFINSLLWDAPGQELLRTLIARLRAGRNPLEDVGAAQLAGWEKHWREHVAQVIVPATSDQTGIPTLDVRAFPLHAAVSYGQTGRVRTLLARGADVNARDNTSFMPLHWAAYRGRLELAELLLAQGAEVDGRDNQGLAPLHWAARQGFRELAELLITKGAAVNAKSHGGLTPLDLAVKQGKADVAELLRQHGGK